MCYEAHCEPQVNENGDWIDLKADKVYEFLPPMATKVPIVEFSEHTVDTKVVLILPKGFSTDVVSRSSVGTKLGLQLMNSFGAIDNSYCGQKDTIKASFRAYKHCIVNPGDRLIQFRVILSQFSSFSAKMKWLFSSGIELIKIDVNNNSNRGGYGTSGR